MPDQSPRVRALRTVGRIMGVAPETLIETSSPDSVEAWDSLKHMSMVLALEEEFGVRFSDEQIMGLSSVGIILSTLDELVR
jgi:acyl carrier protein